MNDCSIFSADALKLDAARTVEQITAAIREQVFKELRRKGVVLGLSGGIDSSVVAALSALALGKEKIFALLMPERESSEDSLTLGRLVADHLEINALVEDIPPFWKALVAINGEMK
jgi:NAD+ synthase